MTEICVDFILPNPEQPRKTFDPASERELANSILEHGLIQPITVEMAGKGTYILHDGERRLRAAKLAGMRTIEAHVVEAVNGAGPRSRLERALVANLQRDDMNIVEEARALQRMEQEFGLSRQEIGERLGKTGGAAYQYVFHRLLILELEEPIQELIAEGKLPSSPPATLALRSIKDPETRLKLARMFAARRSTIKAIQRACEKAVEGEQIKHFDDSFNAMKYARAKAKFYKAIPPDWGSLEQLGVVPPWGKVVEAARQTCEVCPLRSMASKAVCGDCGVVEFLRRMMA